MVKLSWKHHRFIFNFPGGTSRGVLTEKDSWFIKLWDEQNPEIYGIGEVSILPGLSPENPKMVVQKLEEFCNTGINGWENLHNMPAVKFGIETALRDLQTGGKQILYPSEFTKGQKAISINGLVWMGDKNLMKQRIGEKLQEGFTCIKIKIGAINFNDELELLREIRKEFSPAEIEIRVDANGAFKPKEALKKLEKLAEFHLHSIEQPIAAGQWVAMQNLCKNSPIAIALDEELIGLTDKYKQIELIQSTNPQYIILKPSLIGGLGEAQNWIELANENSTGWWLTSALEGNIGLNAIAQWTYMQNPQIPQGLGTGKVFTNNISSPLLVNSGSLWHKPELKWDFSF